MWKQVTKQDFLNHMGKCKVCLKNPYGLCSLGFSLLNQVDLTEMELKMYGLDIRPLVRSALLEKTK